jgi:amino acid adenylation domain-containing protein
MFLLQQLMPGLSAYNVPRLMTFRGTLDAAVLQEAFDTVAARHEILRTTISLLDGAPVPRVAQEASVPLTVADLRAHPNAHAEADGLVAEIAWRPFDVALDMMLRAALVRLPGDEDRLLIVSHHLVSDHGSTPILLSELAEVYDAVTRRRRPRLRELPIQYADFAVWQRERLTGSVPEEHLEYWRARLADVPDRLDLPADRPRPAAKTYRGATRPFVLPAELVEPLRALARARGVSIFVVLVAAFKTLLHRYTGVEDVVVGSPISGRHHEETAPLIGFFTNTLVLRTSLEGDPTFSELLERVKETTFGAYAQQELPFEKLVEALNPQRDLSHTPFFQVLFAYDVAMPPFELGGLPATPTPLPEWPWSRFDLSLGTRERADGGLDGAVEYSTDLFDDVTVDRMFANFATLVEGIASDPDRPISALPLLTPGERELLLEEWNATAMPLMVEGCLHDLVAGQAGRTPEAVAVLGDGRQLTYGELDARANQLARHLQELGAGPGVLVGICTERVPELMVAILGVLKTGAAYVPIDPTYPAERQAFMLEDAETPVLVTQEALLESLPPSDAAVVCLDRDWAQIATQPADPTPAAADADALAYVIYTSGSTGQPKGVEIRHRSVVNLVESMLERPGLTADDVLVNVTTSAFDLSVPDLYLPLVCGARLVILPRDITLDPARLAPALAAAHATFVQATPTTWGMLVEAGWQGLEGLKIVCGGEALPRALANELLERGESLWHMYGPTETTVWSSVLRLERGDEASPPIGGPIANTRFYVVDGHLQPVPIGVPGELLIGGAGVARGYRGRPELTAEKFIPDPFDSTEGARVYRTGDHVRYRPGGTLEFLGRLDQQVKLHGFRIELGEIEALLDRHPDVRTSVAIVREDTPRHKLLVAYAVLESAATVSTEALRRYLGASLPGYMVPSVILEIDELPVTANRKLDRSALPAPDAVRPDFEHAYVAPRTPIEERLAQIWAEILQVDTIGTDDNFFDLGGHSMLALRMVARVQDTFAVDLFLTAVFEHPTVAELAEAIAIRMLDAADDEDLTALLAEVEAAGGA